MSRKFKRIIYCTSDYIKYIFRHKNITMTETLISKEKSVAYFRNHDKCC